MTDKINPLEHRYISELEPVTDLPNIDEIIDAVGRSGRKKRFMLMVNKESRVPTGHINVKAKIQNVSDVRSEINNSLTPFEVIIKYEDPPTPILNGYGEPTGQKLYSLFKLREAANDSDFNSGQGDD